MNLPIRYFVINNKSNSYLLSSNIITIANVLHICFRFYIFKDQQAALLLNENLQNNPDSINIDIVPIELLFERKKTLTEIADLIFHLDHILQNIKTNETQISIDNTFKIYLSKKNIYILLSFCKQFVEHYDFFKLQITNIKQEYKEKQEQKVSSVFQEPLDVDVKKNNKINVNENILNDFLGLSPNNVCTYFICKQLKITNNNFEIINKNEILEIKLNSLFDFGFENYSLSIFKDINNITHSVNWQLDEYKSKVINLFQLFNYLIKNEKNQVIVSNSLKVFTFLIFIFGIKILDFNINRDLKNNMNYVLQRILNSVIKKYPLLKYKKIKVIFNDSHKKNVDEEKLCNKLVDEYSYLISLDETEFINTIINKINENNTDLDKNETPNNNTLILNNPRIINIENFIFLNDSNSLLSFKNISPPEHLKTHNIISNEYLQILQLVNSEKIVLNNINLIVSKFSEIILKEIFPNINKNYTEFFDKKISTLIIMNKFINPYLNEQISNYNRLFLLYKIIIPYLYDNYNSKIFIDYFL